MWKSEPEPLFSIRFLHYNEHVWVTCWFYNNFTVNYKRWKNSKTVKQTYKPEIISNAPDILLWKPSFRRIQIEKNWKVNCRKKRNYISVFRSIKVLHLWIWSCFFFVIIFHSLVWLKMCDTFNVINFSFVYSV